MRPPSISRPHHRGVTAPPPASSAPSTVSPTSTAAPDPYFLSWGSSVNVCEDLRRSIRTEIEDIDKGIEGLQINIKNEERTSNQLTKDLSHAESEMAGFRRTMADELDGATMNDQVRNRLGDAFKSELVAIVAVDAPSSDETPSASSSDNPGGNDDGREDVPQEEGEARPSSFAALARENAASTIKTYLAERKKRLKHISHIIQQERESLNQIKTEDQTKEEQIKAVNERIETEQLVANLKSAEKDEESRKRDVDVEFQRKRATKEAVQQARANAGGYAQQIADNTKTLWSNKSKFASEEAELAKLLAAEEEAIRQLEAANAGAEGELKTLMGQLDCLTNQLVEADSIRKARADKKLEREKVQTDRAEHKTQQELLREHAGNVRGAFQAAGLSLEEAKRLGSAVVAERKSNDELEAERVRLEQAELADLMKEKENLAGITNELHQKHREEVKKNEDALGEKEQELSSLRAEAKQVQEELDATRLSLAEIEQVRKKAEDVTTKEVDENKDLCTNLDEATQAEQSRIEELKKQHDDERQEQIETIMRENAQIRADLEGTLALRRLAVELNCNCESTVSYLKESPLDI